MQPNLLYPMRTAGLSRRVASPILALVIVVALVAGYARGEAPMTIYRATLQEPNQKTPEVSTEDLRQLLADQSAIVFDVRVGSAITRPIPPQNRT